ncbi:hypothetical protein C8Q77DRAFT_594672 [Trametes polyzona]|nr:hypothetical protein C8Q77DRAFT_594672 [Trametes polyzona]
MFSGGPLGVVEDSGIPAGSADYTTVVILHGFVYHSKIFTKLVPLGRLFNARGILVNRRDYPGSVPYTEEELSLLAPQPLENAEDDDMATAMNAQGVEAFMMARAREVCQLLEGLVTSGEVPIADRKCNVGGITIAGWSMGTGWMTALLTYAPSFPVGTVNLADYILRVVFLDPPFCILGYPTSENGLYNPLFEEDIPPEERESAFVPWVSGYFKHGSTGNTLALKTPLENPTPTLARITPQELASIVYHPPGKPDGSDAILLHRGIEVGLWMSLRRRSLARGRKHGWDSVEVRNITCEQSVCDCLWSMMCLKKDVEEARSQGLPVRDVRFVSIRNANHFVQWDQPENLLRALIGDEAIV